MNCWKKDYVRQPLRRHDLPPITDGAAAMLLARGDRARELVERPAYITGFDHRTECHNPALRRLDDSPSTRIAAAEAGLARRTARGSRRTAGGLHPRGAAAAVGARAG
jgi:acetyl-CoA acetyltransferase